MNQVSEYAGIYWIINKKTNYTYIGETFWLRTRLKDHYWGLNANKHYNKPMQEQYNGADSNFIFNYKELEREKTGVNVDGMKLIEEENKAIEECLEANIPLFNIYIPKESRFKVYNKKRPVIRVSPEEKKLIEHVRKNPKVLAKWIAEIELGF